MKTKASVTGPKGKVKLAFGIYGLKNFCKRLGCEPTIGSVLSAFQGGTKLEAMVEIIRSGAEQHSADQGELVSISDYEAAEVMETVTTSESEKAMKAFFSSIIGEEYDTWFERIQKEIESHTAASTEELAEDSEKKSDQP